MRSEQVDDTLMLAAMINTKKLLDELTQEQQQELNQKIEKIIADLLEWKSLEVYEIFVDQYGRIIIKARNKETGEDITMVYDMATQTVEKLEESRTWWEGLVPASTATKQLLLQKLFSPETSSFDEDFGMLQFLLSEEELQELKSSRQEGARRKNVVNHSS